MTGPECGCPYCKGRGSLATHGQSRSQWTAETRRRSRTEGVRRCPDRAASAAPRCFCALTYCSAREMAAARPQTIAQEEIKRWIVVYPNYINKLKSVQEGRRIPKEVAVENPKVPECAQVWTCCQVVHQACPWLIFRYRFAMTCKFGLRGRYEEGRP